MANIYTVNENDEALYRTTKYLQYIMKFIIRSRLLFANLNQDKDRELFVANLEELLESFSELIKYQNDLLKSQGALLKYLHIIASDLMQVYDPVKLSQKIVDIITNVPTGRLNQSKMTCIKDVVDSKLFKLPKCRAILLPVFCRQIKDKLESKEEVRNALPSPTVANSFKLCLCSFFVPVCVTILFSFLHAIRLICVRTFALCVCCAVHLLRHQLSLPLSYFLYVCVCVCSILCLPVVCSSARTYFTCKR